MTDTPRKEASFPAYSAAGHNRHWLIDRLVGMRWPLCFGTLHEVLDDKHTIYLPIAILHAYLAR